MTRRRRHDPDGVDPYVGSRVRMRRLMLGLSQEKLAEAIGLTFQQVQKYERGTNRMGASRLHQIANVLKVPVTFFFEGAPGQSGAGGKTLPGFVHGFVSTTEGLALARAYMNLPQGLRLSIVDLVEEIAHRNR
jgi:ribosome-binding protein aMBF1 (putative translation factor)